MADKATLSEQQTEKDTRHELSKVINATVVVSSSKNFDFNLVCDSFLRSIHDQDAINICFYLQGYSELNK